MTLSLRPLSNLLAVLLLIPFASPANSQDIADAENTETAAEATATVTDNKAATEADADTFPLPDDLESPEEYLALVREIATENQPEVENMEGIKAFNMKLARTVLKLTDKALAMEPESETELSGYSLHLQALRILDRFGEAGSGDKINKLVEKLRADERADFRALGMKYYIETGFSKWSTLEEKQKKEKLKELASLLKEGDADPSKMNTILELVTMLQQYGDLELAKSLLNEVVPRFESSDDPRIAKRAEKMRGLVRRLELPGNQLELTGTLLDGTELDWESYRGKVVLVDFWATWCGPCRMEFPNVLKQYELYHDKGFEVLGISLDDNKQELESFLEENELPWPNLFSEDEENSGFDHPMATRFGVMGIPQTILVDAEGKVVSLSARGPALPELLRELLGEPKAAESDDSKTDSEPS